MTLKRIIIYIFNLILLGFVMFLYGFSNNRNAKKSIHKIEIKFESKEPNFLTKSMVNKLLIQNNEKVQKQAKSLIDLYKLEQKVLENPYVEKASIFISIDGILNSFIKQRKPIARILTGNSSYYIDSQASKVPLSENYSARVPLITKVNNDISLTEIIMLLKKISNDDFLNEEITGIHFKNNEEYMMTVRSGNYRVDFGKLEQIDNKIKKLKAFYSKVFKDSTIHNYKTINIKYRNQVVGVKE
tara:strand:- start:10754 stop:11482 length:729 start_codon:yes stop_codon:yes gene_type:complete